MKLELSCIKCLRDKEVKRAMDIADGRERAEYLQKVDEILQGEREMSPPEYLGSIFCCERNDG